MSLSLKKESLKRYKDFAMLLIKYGRSDLVSQMGMDDVVSDTQNEINDGKPSLADELPNDLEKLGPTFIKLGQFLSTRPDLIPPKYIDALSRLQDKVQPIPFEVVEETITNELGAKINKLFLNFEKEPLAAASLSQVHLAELHDGRKVAVKVQRPDIRSMIINDLQALGDIAEIAEQHTDAGKRFRPHMTLNEFRKAVIRELDFLVEARNLNTLKENLKGFNLIVIPEPISSYTTSKVLTMEFIKGKKVTSLTPLGRMEINGKALADELFRAYLQQILINGFYHADPHPGNIFITDDGKIALIDLGMVGYLSEEMQKKLLQILIDISEGRGALVAKEVIEISDTTQEMDINQFTQQIGELVSIHHNLPLQQIEVGRALLEVTRVAGDFSVILPNELAMLGKTLLSLDKAGRTLDPAYDPNDAIRRYAQELFSKKMKNELNSQTFINAILDSKELITLMPRRLNKIVENLADGNFRVKMDAFDEKYLMTGFQKIANRLTLGIIIGSMIVGAALMMDVNTSFRIMDYPGIAMIFFLLAGVGGLIIGIKMLISDEPVKKKDRS